MPTETPVYRIVDLRDRDGIGHSGVAIGLSGVVTGENLRVACQSDGIWRFLSPHDAWVLTTGVYELETDAEARERKLAAEELRYQCERAYVLSEITYDERQRRLRAYRLARHPFDTLTEEWEAECAQVEPDGDPPPGFLDYAVQVGYVLHYGVQLNVRARSLEEACQLALEKAEEPEHAERFKCTNDASPNFIDAVSLTLDDPWDQKTAQKVPDKFAEEGVRFPR